MRDALLRDIPFAMIAALLLLAAGASLPHGYGAKPAEPFIEVGMDAYVLAAPEPIPAFRLLGADGKRFDHHALKGRWSFLFFGFTHCPDLCPTTLAVLNEVHRMLREHPGGQAGVRFIMVSVDPERDTPQRLQPYVAAFNPEFVGLTGDAGEIARLSASLGVVYAKVPTESSYSMDHSSSVLLADPEGRFHGVFAAPHVPQNMARAFLEIRKRAQP